MGSWTSIIQTNKNPPVTASKLSIKKDIRTLYNNSHSKKKQKKKRTRSLSLSKKRMDWDWVPVWMDNFTVERIQMITPPHHHRRDYVSIFPTSWSRIKRRTKSCFAIG